MFIFESEFTFLCKSSRGLESQKPVLAIITAGGRVSVMSRCSYLSTGVGGGLELRETMLPGQGAPDKDRQASLIGGGTSCEHLEIFRAPTHP